MTYNYQVSKPMVGNVELKSSQLVVWVKLMSQRCFNTFELQKFKMLDGISDQVGDPESESIAVSDISGFHPSS